MNISIRFGLPFLLALTSCASPAGHEKATKAASSMDSTRFSLERAKLQVESTMQAAEKLAAQPQGDLRPQYDRLAGAVDRMKECADDEKACADELNNRTQEHLAAWREELSHVRNNDVAKVSDERRKRVFESFDRLTVEMHTAREALESFVRDVDDLRTVVATDLTPEGLAAVRPIVEKTRPQAVNVMKQIDEAIVRLGEMSTALSAVSLTGSASRPRDVSGSSSSKDDVAGGTR